MKKHTLKSIAILGTLASSMALSQVVLAEEVDPSEEATSVHSVETETTEEDYTLKHPEEYYAIGDEKGFVTERTGDDFDSITFDEMSPNPELVKELSSKENDLHEFEKKLDAIGYEVDGRSIEDFVDTITNRLEDYSRIDTVNDPNVSLDTNKLLKYTKDGLLDAYAKIIKASKDTGIQSPITEADIERVRKMPTDKLIRAITVEINDISPTGEIVKTETKVMKPWEGITAVYDNNIAYYEFKNLKMHDQPDSEEYSAIYSTITQDEYRKIGSGTIWEAEKQFIGPRDGIVYGLALENGLGNAGHQVVQAARGKTLIVNRYAKTDKPVFDKVTGYPLNKLARDIFFAKKNEDASTQDGNSNPTVDTTKPTDGVVADNNGSTDNTAVNKPNTDVKPDGNATDKPTDNANGNTSNPADTKVDNTTKPTENKPTDNANGNTANPSDTTVDNTTNPSENKPTDNKPVAPTSPSTDVKPSADSTKTSDKTNDTSDTPQAPQGSASTTPSAPSVTIATPTAQGQTLPATGESDTFAVFSLSALAILASVGLVAPVVRRREQ